MKNGFTNTPNLDFTGIAGLAETEARNPALRWVVLGAGLFLVVVLTVPFAQRLFHFAPLHIGDLVLCLATGVACVSWFELVKVLGKHQRDRA